ncbi:hypothetical protein UVI_02042470 [Ustilaginoidea virens]|uniref:Uncharacterized protein n=1 Tax=Ustilaginoidea virens TaxID=1159556 RepID=A0A1B5L779_USTVR|nr:hypothetical protein UVI_02042470 [Ustilaginoidea virens]
MPGTILEAERADRISRLAGLERVSTLRAGPGAAGGATAGAFPANFPSTHNLTPSYFDNNGQPVAVTKLSTVGTASATESQAGDDNRTTPGEREEDTFSSYTSFREAESVASTGAEPDPDEDMDMMGTRSVGGFEDRMSDDGTASLVGFGEGAGSTVSGPIYRRGHPGPPAAVHAAWTLERTNSGMSAGGRPVSGSAAPDRKDPRMLDGVAVDPPGRGNPTDHDHFVDTTLTGPVPVEIAHGREAADRTALPLVSGESSAGPSGLASPRDGGHLEGDKRRD